MFWGNKRHCEGLSPQGSEATVGQARGNLLFRVLIH